MAIVIIQNRDKRQVSYSGQEASVRRYYTIKDCNSFTEVQAINALIDDIGGYGSFLPEDHNFLLTNIELASASNNDNIYYAIITYTYTPPQPDNPEYPLTWTYSTENEQKILKYDQDYKPILNSIQDRFSEAIMGIENICVFDFSTTSLIFDARYAYELNNTVNRDYFLGQAPRTLKFTDLKTSFNKEGTYDVSFKLSYKKDTWDEVEADNGFNSLQVKDGRLQKLPILRGMLPVSEPMPLDGRGREVPDGSPPVFLTFRVLNEVDFSQYLLG